LYKLSKGARNALVIFLFSLVLLPAAVFFSFIFISFFINPIDLFHRLMAFDIRTAGGIAGASVTLVTLLDFAFLRQRFCISICPYGYLQSMLSDKHTLLVNYVDPEGECIGCKNCIRTCPMGIDIRLSNRQIECTHCGECIDACATVRGKSGKESLIFYAWGDSSQRASDEKAWYRKLGLRDGKRVAVLVLMLLYASALTLFISLRKPVLVHIMPDRSSLYTIDEDGMIHNHFRLLASNRGHKDALLRISTADLQGARIVGVDQGVKLVSGQTVQKEFDVVAVPGSVTPGINPMTILTVVTPDQKMEPLRENFFAPDATTDKH
jgi:polyferredoxin